MLPGDSRHANDFHCSTFVRDDGQKDIHSQPPQLQLPHLPGQVCAVDSPARNSGFGYNNMNSPPGETGEHQNSTFSGMYESDSNYRWRKVRGNLDLFVMERNERHLTSLQWKWQKMSKSRRRTPVYEELDTYFYDRWKNADDRQNDNPGKCDEDRLVAENQQNAKYHDPQHAPKQFPDYINQQRHAHQVDGQQPSKWSRYGYNNQQEPAYQPAYQQRVHDFPLDGRYPDEVPDPRVYPNGGQSVRWSPTKRTARPNRAERDYPGVEMEPPNESGNYGQQYWGRKSTRYPPNPYSPQNHPAFQNYGYVPEYGGPMHYPPHQHHEYNSHQFGFPQGSNNRGAYDRRGGEPWMKKEMPTYDYNRPDPNSAIAQYDGDRRFASGRDPYGDKVDTESEFPNPGPLVSPISRQGRRRFLESREGSRSRRGPYYEGDTATELRRGSLPLSRRQRRELDAVSTVAEDDDEVFASPSPKRNTDRNEGAENLRWAEAPRTVAFKDYGDQETVSPSKKRDLSSPTITSPRVRNAEPLFTQNEFRPMHKENETNDQFTPDYQNNRKPESVTNSRAMGYTSPYIASKQPPPLRAEHISSVKEDGSPNGTRSPASPCISLGSSATSSGKQRRSGRSRSGKRVAFASRNDAEEERAFSPKREKLEDFHNAYQGSDEYNNVHCEKTTHPPMATMIKNDVKNTLQSPDLFRQTPLDQETTQTESTKHDTQEAVLDMDHSNRSPDNERPPEMSQNRDPTIHLGDLDFRSCKSASNAQNMVFAEEAKKDSEVSSTSGEDVMDSVPEDSKLPIEVVINRSPASELLDSPVEQTNFDEPQTVDEEFSPSEKSKSSLWQLAKNLQKRMGTKLNLYRERSKMSSLSSVSGEVKTSPGPMSQQAIQETVQTDSKEVNASDKEVNEDSLTICLNKENLGEEMDHIKQKNPDQQEDLKHELQHPDNFTKNCSDSLTKGAEFPSSPTPRLMESEMLNQSTQNANESSVPLSKSKDICSSGSSMRNQHLKSEGSDTLNKEEEREAKHFYEEEMKMAEHRRRNEEKTNQLIKEQQQMEEEIVNLRRILSEELKRQKEGNDAGDKFDDKIAEIERQLDDLDKKMTNTNERLKETEMEGAELKRPRIASGETMDELPGNAPLFILADPKNGTAAALAQGGYCDSTQGDGMIQPQNISYYNHSGYQGSLSPPSSFTAHQEALEETKKQQEHLKEDLEMQMAVLKAELEQQLHNQSIKPELSGEVEYVIDARVTNLEMQISEMYSKIMDTEIAIENAEIEHRKAKKKMEEERLIWEESRKKQEEELRMRAEEQRLREIENSKPNSERKLLRMPSSPKVSPISLRRQSIVDGSLDDSSKIQALLNGDQTQHSGRDVEKAAESSKKETPQNKSRKFSFPGFGQRKPSEDKKPLTTSKKLETESAKNTKTTQKGPDTSKVDVLTRKFSFLKGLSFSRQKDTKPENSETSKRSKENVTSGTKLGSDTAKKITPKQSTKAVKTKVPDEKSAKITLNQLANPTKDKVPDVKSAKITLNQIANPAKGEVSDDKAAEQEKKAAPSSSFSWLQGKFLKGNKKQEEIKLNTLSSSKVKTPKSDTTQVRPELGKPRKSFFKSNWPSSSEGKSKTTSSSKSPSSDAMSQSKKSSSDAKSFQQKGSLIDREMTVTTIESDFNQVGMETSAVQSRGSEWASGRKTGTGWGGSRRSLLEGLGTSWCVCPKQVWKHLGDENDDEPVTRRKCISVIMAVILALLLLSIVIGLIVGIASNMKGEEESPIKFVVIPGTEGSDGG